MERGLKGDVTALCLERIAPRRKDPPVTFELPPLTSAADAAQTAAAILAAVAAGELPPSEGAHIMALVETCRCTLELTELESRIAALEAR